uniref:Uncharacterized protein n=1 Tax=Candidatus Kentrum sp. FW TaxID=2126338 RepID=A0A450STM1_9GAMM|nr:MAG: hypothetical protein BECKFW1821A_GA0114235_10706 [Candidatus Kentron sp. FW]
MIFHAAGNARQSVQGNGGTFSERHSRNALVRIPYRVLDFGHGRQPCYGSLVLRQSAVKQNNRPEFLDRFVEDFPDN